VEGQASIGEKFRQCRSERGLSVEQAAFQSKVPLRLVQAFESDDYHLFPDPVYLTRHLYDYAAFLRLDPVAVQAEFQEASRRPQAVLVPPPAPRLALTIAWKQVCWTAGVLLLVTPLVFIALSLASKRAAERQTERTDTASEEAGDASTLLPDRVLRDDAVASASTRSVPSSEGAVSSGEGAASAPSDSKHVLVVQAHETTWMSVQADRGERKQVLLQPGETERFTAEERLHVIVGNAGGVTLTFDGRALPALGARGAVIRDLILPPPGGPAGAPVRAPAQP
jgi:cytoskeleton protein RodZ